MRILVCGGRDYGMTILPSGVRIPNEREIRRVNTVLATAYEQYCSNWNVDFNGNDTSGWTPDEAVDGYFGWNTSLPLPVLQPKFTVITGGARGADSIAKSWGDDHPVVEVETFYADWDKYKRSAGPKRNVLMLRESKPTAVVAFPGGTGTAHMVTISKEAGVPVMVVK